MFNVKISELLILMYRKIFSAFYLISHETFSILYKKWNIFSPHLVLYDRKYFCSILTKFEQPFTLQVNIFFHQKFPLLSSDLKNVLTKDFPMQPFVNILQIRCCCKFLDNHKKYLCWSLFLIYVLMKLQDWWPATLLKETPTPVFSCECLQIFEKDFLWNASSGCLRMVLKNF